jgi:hypothetical protein
MRDLSALALCVLVAVTAAGCVEPFGDGGAIRGSGDLVTIEEDHDGFVAVEIGDTFHVEIARGATYSVSITTDDNVADHVRVSVDDDRLRIRMDDDHSYRDATLEATITMPAIERLAVSGVSTAALSGFRSDDDLELEISGASTLTGDVTSGDLTCEVSGASRLTLDGGGAALDLRASGASTVSLGDFPAWDADVDLSGASSAEINASGTISATLSGASRLEYRGGAVLADVNTSGASTVRSLDD